MGSDRFKIIVISLCIMVGNYHKRLREIIDYLIPLPNLQALYNQQEGQQYYEPAIEINHLKESVKTLEQLQYIFESMHQAAQHSNYNSSNRAREISNFCVCSKLDMNAFTSRDLLEALKRKQQREKDQIKKRKRQFNKCCIPVQTHYKHLFDSYQKLKKINKSQQNTIIELNQTIDQLKNQCRGLRLQRKEYKDAIHQINDRCQQLASQRQEYINKIYNQDREIVILKHQLERLQPQQLIPNQNNRDNGLILLQLKALNQKVEALEKCGHKKQDKFDQILHKISELQLSSSKQVYKRKKQNLSFSSSVTFIQCPRKVYQPVNSVYQQIQEIQSGSEIIIPPSRDVKQSIKQIIDDGSSKLRAKLQMYQTGYS